MPTILIHISNEDPILGEVENLPNPNDQMIQVKNPRRRDGKDLHYLQANVTEVIWPLNRVAFIEIIPGENDEQIIGFVRE
ncbi:MAG: hypothetical protein NT121_09110 [Chloroflexi bacterium]|nr:hypothetical protein [Chloroflexota bacterium]